jgi:hypothetical protein
MTARRGWPEAVRAACFWLWASTGARNASRTARLYQAQRPAGARGPSPATIRRWRAEECWQAWIGGDDPPLPTQNGEAWRRMWFRHKTREIETALSLHSEVLAGSFDDVADAAASLATVTAVLSDPAVRALLRGALVAPGPPSVPLTRRERRVRERLRR